VTFEWVVMPSDEQLILMASDAGYGFVIQGADMQAKNRAGKSLINLPKNARVLAPKTVENFAEDWLAVVSNEGRLLVFPVAELPQLSRGKGNKLIGIPTDRAAKREEWLVDFAVLNEQSSLVVHAGKRTLTLKFNDLEHYRGERGRRGNKLPRGFQRVDQLQVEP